VRRDVICISKWTVARDGLTDSSRFCNLIMPQKYKSVDYSGIFFFLKQALYRKDDKLMLFSDYSDLFCIRSFDYSRLAKLIGNFFL
jgi:hypothetical protein